MCLFYLDTKCAPAETGKCWHCNIAAWIVWIFEQCIHSPQQKYSGNWKLQNIQHLILELTLLTSQHPKLFQSKDKTNTFLCEKRWFLWKFIVEAGSKNVSNFEANSENTLLALQHPELFKYSGDQTDKEWLAKASLMATTGGKVQLIVISKPHLIEKPSSVLLLLENFEKKTITFIKMTNVSPQCSWFSFY